MPDAYGPFRKLCYVALAAICAFFTYKLLAYHGWLICFPWPNQSREAAMMLSTDLLLKGDNPYLLSHQPIYTNLYGLLYNFCVYPVARLFGPTMLVHKAVAGAFLLGSCGLYYVILRRIGIMRLYVWAAVLLLYASLLMRTTPLPGPDTMGTFLLLASVFWPWLRNFSWPSLLASVLLGVAAFYTKPYFVLGALCLGSFLFCFVSVKKGFIYLAACGLLLLLVAILLNHVCETYFYNTFLVYRNFIVYNAHYMVAQLRAYISFYRELLVLGLVAAVINVCRWWFAGARCVPFSQWFKAVRQAPTAVTLPVFGFSFMLVLFCVKLGGNDGAWLTYLFHLVTPFLLLVIFQLIRNDRRSYVLNVGLLAASLFFVTRGYAIQPVHSFESHENWEKIQGLIGSHTNILSAPPFAPILMAQGKPVYDAGQGEYFFSIGSKPPPVPWLFPLVPQLQERNRQYLEQIAADIRSKRFDLMLLNVQLSTWLLPPPSVISTYYDHKDSLRLFMPHSGYIWAIEAWEPKP